MLGTWADHKHMLGSKQKKRKIFNKIATDFNTKTDQVQYGCHRIVHAEMGQATL